ncbi:hypothetical protein ABT56_20295 [Photobacterium aquae]|uniref:Uncharacterized protein n=1 Tax=Photobacterium aquae TaxID=1195763 RepID=A0A0J1GU66_9GAMM|nr:hypothetical protein [Photobacterium aquae]KLV03268.1 hypothetical protein ABT56_20295 [Photobacterium aquae]
MKRFNQVRKFAVSHSNKIVGGALVLASGSAFAEGAGGNTAAIQGAISSGKNMIEMTTGGLITLAAAVFGVMMVVNLLSKR